MGQSSAEVELEGEDALDVEDESEGHGEHERSERVGEEAVSAVSVDDEETER